MAYIKGKKTKPITFYGLPNVQGLSERMDHDHREVIFTRSWAMPNHETFKIEPIKRLLKRYVKPGQVWIDPFAGANSPAGITNDHNPAMKTKYHMEAVDFVKKTTSRAYGILFDPPYSFRQISEHYKVIGKKATAQDTSMKFYEKVKSAACEKIVPGGYAISFGWNSNGFGRARGFELIEILMVAHGGSKNDTICVVERKAK